MKTLKLSKILYAFILICLVLSPLAAQDTPAEENETLKVETLLVNVPVIVSDRDGRYIGGLQKESFYIIENGVQRPLDFFADSTQPLNVVILIDTSYSTVRILENIKEAALSFVKVLRPEDQAMIAGFDSVPRIWSEFTNDKKELETAISRIHSGNYSVMYDTVYLLLKKHFQTVKGRKAIIVLTDGEVIGRAVSEKILLDELAESDVIIYPIIFSAFSVYNQPKIKKTAEIIERENTALARMNKFSTATGGRIFNAEGLDFKKSFERIAEELKNQYVVGFYPSENLQTKFFQVGLRLSFPKAERKNVVMRVKKRILPKRKNP